MNSTLNTYRDISPHFPNIEIFAMRGNVNYTHVFRSELKMNVTNEHKPFKRDFVIGLWFLFYRYINSHLPFVA